MSTALVLNKLGLLAAICVGVFLGLPILALYLKIPWHQLPLVLLSDEVVQALVLTIKTSFVSMAIVVLVGVPVSYLLARRSGTAWRFLGILLELPMVMPPAVAGVALLMAFGHRGLMSEVLGTGWSFSTAAVSFAQVFVGAPFFIRSAHAAFSAVPRETEQASWTLGVSPTQTLFRVTIPLALPGLFSGLIMAWARAIGEFGATIMFAGNLKGVSRTMPLAIYTAIQDDFPAAMVMSALMVTVAVIVLFVVRLMRNEYHAAS